MKKLLFMKKLMALSFVAILMLSLSQAEAKKKPKPDTFPIGVTQECQEEHFKASLFYLAPKLLEQEGTLKPKKSDLHVRACVQALADNSFGLEVDQLVPGLAVSYKFTKQETGESVEGSLLPLEMKDGPCYGNNLKLPGMGTYKCELSFTLSDKASEPKQLTWLFKYIPRLKW